MQLLCTIIGLLDLSEREVNFISRSIIQLVALLGVVEKAGGIFFNPGPEPLSWIIGPNNPDEAVIVAFGERVEKMLGQLVQAGYPEATVTVTPYFE